MSCLSYSFYVYLIILVFLSGILVVVNYFASLSTFIYKGVYYVLYFPLFLFFIYPYFVVCTSVLNLSLVYYYSFVFLFIVFFLIVFLFLLNYIISGQSALRSL